jgi:hypothetical protein
MYGHVVHRFRIPQLRRTTYLFTFHPPLRFRELFVKGPGIGIRSWLLAPQENLALGGCDCCERESPSLIPIG